MNVRPAATAAAFVTGPVGRTGSEGLDCGDEPALLLLLTVNV